MSYLLEILIVVTALHYSSGDQQCNEQGCITSIESLDRDSLVVKENRELVRKEIGYTALDTIFFDLANSALNAYTEIYEYQYTVAIQISIKNLYKNVASLYSAVTTSGKEFSVVIDASVEHIKQSYSIVTSSNGGRGTELASKIDAIIEGVGTLKEESNKLKIMADKHTKEADNVLQQLFAAKEAYAKELAEYKAVSQQLQATKASLEESKKQAAIHAKKAEEFARQAADARHRTKKKIKKKKKGLFGLAGIFYEVVDDVFGIELLKKYENQEKSARQEQATHEARAKNEQQKYAQAENELKVLQNKLSENEQKINQINRMTDSLRKVIDHCDDVVTALLDLENFWDEMNIYCNQFKDGVALKELGIADKIPDEIVKSFQDRVGTFYAKWFALKLETDIWLGKRKSGLPAIEDGLTKDQANAKIARIKDEL